MCLLQKAKASMLFFLLRMPGNVRFPIQEDRGSGNMYLLSTKSWTAGISSAGSEPFLQTMQLE